ncbi:cytochrome oxidase maturation protein, cbb3-type [Marinobacter daqiaonensis]|uniref:Cytochrome oxidase maturation protein, cbb3-type n=1 Tax=Marinobacter daqiaonensis TaxID=650891 RepID=A0A1I6H2P5_9GAMM|nr:cbb3-type cytochrome oxidase assembly protein CcoS [Marinobacter daqiaonensis]SFR48694.1 cytochrome oxidase maturation protein, cbb3-type [Marinobacter daqiaonensis]
MNILLILIPIALLLVTAGVLLFNWAVKNGQYDDLDGPAHRILYDDDKDMIPDDAKQPRDREGGQPEAGKRKGGAGDDGDHGQHP